ncbi:MAG: hypothetical protein LBS20_00035 [Prevotella sp.]|nr:hypothetical protein [Prevotella sp.]
MYIPDDLLHPLASDVTGQQVFKIIKKKISCVASKVVLSWRGYSIIKDDGESAAR